MLMLLLVVKHGGMVCLGGSTIEDGGHEVGRCVGSGGTIEHGGHEVKLWRLGTGGDMW